MRYQVLDAAVPGDLAVWLDRWESWPHREIQGHPEYVRLFARPCDRVVCAMGEDAGGTILFPLVVRPIGAEPWAAEGDDRCDATTPYGYGGPYAWGRGGRDDARFWRAHEAFCREARIVTTFARLGLFPAAIPSIPGDVATVAPNVVVPLAGTEESLWRGYEPRVRKWVNVARSAGLDVEIDPEGARLDAFASVYAHTMERNGAVPWYHFPRTFFEAIRDRLRGHFVLFHTLRGAEVVSSDLVLLSARSAYYFLGGTLSETFSLGPNYLLKHRIALWAMSAGKTGYVLGGGYLPGDGLYRYKRGWARGGEVPFRVARLVHDEAALRELAAVRAANAARTGTRWEPRPGFFPVYRS